MAGSLRQDTVYAAQDMAASFTTTPILVEADERYSLHAVYTGAPVGSVVLQFSNDAVSWATADDATGDTTDAIAAAGSTLWIVADNGVRWVRAAYTRTSGTGSMVVTFHSNSDR